MKGMNTKELMVPGSPCYKAKLTTSTHKRKTKKRK